MFNFNKLQYQEVTYLYMDQPYNYFTGPISCKVFVVQRKKSYFLISVKAVQYDGV